MVYTNGVTDANYLQPIFGAIMSIAFAFCCFRSYYNMIIKAVSHYKQTQKSALIEAGINIAVSVLLVWKMGLVGVAVGTLVAMAYRTFSFIIHIHKTVLHVPYKDFEKQIIVDMISCFVYLLSTHYIQMYQVNYFAWAIMALKVFIICAFECVLLNGFFYRKEMGRAINYIQNRRMKGK